MGKLAPVSQPAMPIIGFVLAAGLVDLMAQVSPPGSMIAGQTGSSVVAAAQTAMTPDEKLRRIIRAYEQLMIKSHQDGVMDSSTIISLLERQRTQDLREALGTDAADKADLQLTNIGKEIQDTVRYLFENEQIVITPEETLAIFRLRHEHNLAHPRNVPYSREKEIEENRDANLVERGIREILGSTRFDAFLQRESLDYGRLVKVVTEAGFPPGRAYEVWLLKAEIRSRILAIPIPVLTPRVQEQFESQARLVWRETEAKVINLIGEAAYRNAPPPAFDWVRSN